MFPLKTAIMLRSFFMSAGEAAVSPNEVFQCEFSMNRGPSVLKFLRKRDRECSTYPNLLYPHLFLLDGGYKNFFETSHQFTVCYPRFSCMLTHRRTRSKLEARSAVPGMFL